MRIAIVQDSPVYNDLAGTTEKTLSIIDKAAQEKTELIVFGESWLSGYPFWLDVCADVAVWDHPPVQSVWSNMYDNSVDIAAGDLNPITERLASYQMMAVIGLNEIISTGKGNRTIYNSVIIIDASGKIVNHHRKLMPTYTEKLVYGLGDGHGLNSVETKGGRLGALICWEHWMPMARMAMHDASEDIHIALWPYVKEMHQIACRQYAIEGRCNVIAVGQIARKTDIPNGLELSPNVEVGDFLLRGGSVIYDATGSALTEPVYDIEKTIYFDLPTNDKGKFIDLSVSGHYQRPDIFKYSVNKERE